MDGFEQLAPLIWYRKHATQAAANGETFSLVVLCTWAAASRKHIAKYTERYLQLYPGTADILVLESSMADLAYRSDDDQLKRLDPARDVLLSHVDPGHATGKGEVLLHAFSNGGAVTVSQLIRGICDAELREKAVRALVLDSGPGESGIDRSARAAILLGLPRSGFARALGIPLVYLLLYIVWIWTHLVGVEDSVTRVRRRLNDRDIFYPHVPRLYITSHADDMVPWQDVEKHCLDARSKGYAQVEQVIFDASAHCAHAAIYTEQYWEYVMKIAEGK